MCFSAENFNLDRSWSTVFQAQNRLCILGWWPGRAYWRSSPQFGDAFGYLNNRSQAWPRCSHPFEGLSWTSTDTSFRVSGGCSCSLTATNTELRKVKSFDLIASNAHAQLDGKLGAFQSKAISCLGYHAWTSYIIADGFTFSCACPRPTVGRLYRRMTKRQRAKLSSKGMVKKSVNKEGKKVVPGSQSSSCGTRGMWHAFVLLSRGPEAQSWRSQQHIQLDMACGYSSCTNRTWSAPQWITSSSQWDIFNFMSGEEKAVPQRLSAKGRWQNERGWDQGQALKPGWT